MERVFLGTGTAGLPVARDVHDRAGHPLLVDAPLLASRAAAAGITIASFCDAGGLPALRDAAA